LNPLQDWISEELLKPELPWSSRLRWGRCACTGQRAETAGCLYRPIGAAPGPQTILAAIWSWPHRRDRAAERGDGAALAAASAIRDVARFAIRGRAGSSGQRDTRSPFAGTGCPFLRSPHTLRRWAQYSCSLAPPASATMSHRERIARRSAGNRTTSNVSKRSMTMRAAFQACCTGTELRLPPREQRPTPRPSVPLAQGRAAGLGMSRGSGK
jgi:hypothetical protein